MADFDWVQVGVGGVFAIVVIDRVFAFIKSRGYRDNGNDVTRVLATIVEKCDRQSRDISEIKRQLERHWAKYDKLNDRVTRCEVFLAEDRK